MGKYRIEFKRSHNRQAPYVDSEINLPTETHALEYALAHLEPHYRITVYEVNEFTGVETRVLSKRLRRNPKVPNLSKGIV